MFISEYFGFSPVYVIPPIFDAHLNVHAALPRWTIGRCLGAFNKAVLFRKSQSVG